MDNNGQKWTRQDCKSLDENGQKGTRIDKNEQYGQKMTKMDKNGQEWMRTEMTRIVLAVMDFYVIHSCSVRKMLFNIISKPFDIITTIIKPWKDYPLFVAPFSTL